MNNKSSGLGCVLLIIAAAVIYTVQALAASPWAWAFVVAAVILIVLVRRSSKKNNQLKLIESLESSAQILDDLVAGKAAALEVGFSLQKGERLVYSLPNVALTEYQSTGSTYSGTSVGVSVPIFGQVRGNVGAQGGQFTRNPEQLMAVDQGRAIFTDQRIIFSGAKLVRDWDLDKTIELAPGPNGFNVRIAVSNRERTSGLQALTAYEFGPGFVAAYVLTLHNDGAEQAKKWANDLAKQMRDGAASERAKLGPKEIETK